MMFEALLGLLIPLQCLSVLCLLQRQRLLVFDLLVGRPYYLTNNFAVTLAKIASIPAM